MGAPVVGRTDGFQRLRQRFVLEKEQYSFAAAYPETMIWSRQGSGDPFP